MKNDVTILIPLFNDEKYIKDTIYSCINQAENIIVSDNNSSDDSYIICKELEKIFPNLKVYKQNLNIGAVENHRFLLSKVKTKYVMNIGSHDLLEKNYIKEHLINFRNNPDILMSYSKVTEIDENNNIIKQKDLNDFDIHFSSEKAQERIFKTITMTYNYAYFGLFKTSAFIAAFNDIESQAGLDHLIMTRIISMGKFRKTNKTIFYLRVFDRNDNEKKYMKRINGENITEFDMSYTCTNQLAILKDFIESDTNLYTSVIEDLNFRYSNYCIDYKKNKLMTIINNHRNIVLYGASKFLEHFINTTKPKNIKYILDKDKKKNNTNLNNIKVLNNINLLTEDSSTHIVITPSGRGCQIKEQLISQYNISEKRISILDLE